MNSLLYALLPYWVIKIIRQRRDRARRYRLALKADPKFIEGYLDP